MQKEKKRFYASVAILIGTAIGAGVLGIPYVAAQAGFLVAIAYIVILGLIILTVNLYLGEIALRTKGDHQIPGYAKRYLGKFGRFFTEFATVFGIYAAVVAYMLGIGKSLSFLAFNDSSYTTMFGVVVGLFMSGLLWRGVRALKKYEKIGVSIILLLLVLIFFAFVGDVRVENLSKLNLGNVFLPFGVVLFALMSFHAVPEVRLVLHRREKLMKKVMISGVLVAVVFYSLFAFVVVGSQGSATPEIATLTLGTIFIFLGIFTMFTSYLALGNALIEDFMFDDRVKKGKAWFLASVAPIALFLIVRMFDYFSFTRILSIGGVVSGGLTAVMILLIVKKAKQHGQRKPEYKIPVNWFIVGILSLIFVLGVLNEILGLV